MEPQKSFSPGLLYSVSPGSFSSLHLRDEEDKNGFDWKAHESEYHSESISQVILTLLKDTAAHWGLKRH